MTPPYERDLIAKIFDEFGDAEWARHEATPFARVAFHVHQHYLERFVETGDRALDAGGWCRALHGGARETRRPRDRGRHLARAARAE